MNHDGARPLAYVALGGNMGDPEAMLRSAGRALAALGVVEQRSSLYRTAAVGGPEGQSPYLNAVIGLRPWHALCDPPTLLAALLHIEQVHGRTRRERWGPRRIDLDLLDLGGRVHDGRGVSLPHPRVMERAFVLAPLCEVAPRWRHPATSEGACEALERVGSAGVERTDLSWGTR